MKSILIPTVLENDAMCAVSTAIKHARGKNCSIVMLLVADTPDNYTAAGFLRNGRQPITDAQIEVLNECRTKIRASGNCTLTVHHQCGMSASLLKNLLEYLDTDMIILCPSYKAEKKRIHATLCKLLINSKKNILHLGQGMYDVEFNNALYLEPDNAQMGLQELQQLVSRDFDFKIVSQASIADERNTEDMTPFLTEAIRKNKIDLLVETRKAEKIRMRKRSALASDEFGLPVLSIYEEAAV
ncbi:MAG: hypothetical protein EOO45_17625 [Flavobacterium sp.]|nr:MAG: hypothetical protein EOO45_17625 [Flavobacterium sp.]